MPQNQEPRLLNEPQSSTESPKKFTRQLLVSFVQAVPLIWLSVGLVWYVRGFSIAESWRSAFPLKSHPLWSLGLLLVLATAYWLCNKYGWMIFVRPWALLRSLNKIVQTTIFLTATFYISLIATTFLFPRLTGYTFRSDWALLVVATSPIIGLLLLLLIEHATSVKAKFGGIELEFQRTITASISQTVTVEDEMVTKGGEFELKRVLEDIRAKQELTQILVVRIRTQGQSRVEFLPLRDYVFQVSKIAPLKFIVFVDSHDRYLAFMTVDKFKSKYPKFEIESLLEALERDVGIEMWERIFGFPFPDVHERLERVRWELVKPMWDSTRERPWITERDLDRLGGIRLSLLKPTVGEAYRRMLDHKLAGIPVVDENQKFLGVATRDKIAQEVITNLLGGPEKP